MAYSYVTYIGDGLTDTFPITFQYLDPSHVKVYIDGVDTPFTLPSPSQVKLSQAPPNEAVVRIQRETPKERNINYQNASVLDEAVLDMDFDRIAYVTQEAFDLTESTIAVDIDGKFNAQGRIIKNAAYPVDLTDVATKQYVDFAVAGRPATITVNVKDYGAIGNGQTNDTEAFQRAFNDVGSKGGGIIFIPSGTYLVDPLNILHSNVHLIGAGRDSVIIRLRPQNLVANPEICGLSVGSEDRPTIYNIRLEGFTFDYNMSAHTGSGNANAEGIALDNCHNSVLTDLKVMNVAADGIDLDWCENVLIHRCHVDTTGKNGIHLSYGTVRCQVAYCLVENTVSNTRGGITSVAPGTDPTGYHIYVGNISRNNGKNYSILGPNCVFVGNQSYDGASEDEFDESTWIDGALKVSFEDGYYRQYMDGTLEVFIRKRVEVAVDNPNGVAEGWFRSSFIEFNTPVSFIEHPTISANIYPEGTLARDIVVGAVNSSAATFNPIVQVIAPREHPNASIIFQIKATGRWR